MTKVLIVEDHASMRESLTTALMAAGDFSVVGEVPNAVHPLRWMGNLVAFLDRHISRGSKAGTRIKGMLSYILVLLIFGTVAVALSALSRHYLGEIGWIAVTAVLFKVTFAITSFRRHCRPIQRDLDAGDLDAAAAKTQMIVSRRTAGMDADHIASSCAETVSENLVDSAVSPSFWFGLLGLPGAVMFRCANLMDAMWGYLNDRYALLGRFPAKFDDVLGFVTSRVSPYFIALAGMMLGMDWRRSVPAARAEHTKTPSPNSGWSMTAAAAVLGISMEKKGVYVMGDGPMPTTDDVRRCCRLIELSAMIFLLLVGIILFGLIGIQVQLLVEDTVFGFWGSVL